MKKISGRWSRSIVVFGVIICMAVAALGISSFGMRSYALTQEASVLVEEARSALQTIIAEQEVMAVVYLTDVYAVRSQASEYSEMVAELPSGQTVFILDVAWGELNQIWMKVSFYDGTSEQQGYILEQNLACADERYLEWKGQYLTTSEADVLPPIEFAADGQSAYADIARFPTSYQPALEALKAQHPTWIFVPMSTGLDWDTVIANEMLGGRSLVHKSFPEHVKLGAYDDGNWYYASKEILEMYMDPRNSLHEDAIFQFEQLTYNATYHTEAALEKFLQNTFMNSNQNAPGTVMTYAHIIWAVGAEATRQVSPFHLASRIYQEQGSGNSPLISGTYPGYEGLYNYFNVKASGTTTTEIIVNGLTYAKNANPQWNNAYYSIMGGADVISANYIRKGQDTLYLQKYNVNPNGYYPLYTHQYMQNISAPTSEAKTIRNLYKNAGALESPFVFKIPVYNNMPETACPMPEVNVFADVDKNGWQYSFVKYAYENGLMTGKGNSVDGLVIFDPNSGITREEFVQVLYNREGKPTMSYADKFTDVPYGQWYTNAIMWAAKNKIVAGKDSEFGVEDMITREEIVTILSKYASYKGYDVTGATDISGYTDAAMVSEWAQVYVQWAVSRGIIAGQGDRLAPQANATRAEAATMIKNFIESYN